MRIALAILFCSFSSLAWLPAAENAKPKNMAEVLAGKWTGKTPKGAFELVFNDKGEFVSGHFFNFPLKSCKVKGIAPFEFEVVYAIEKMNGMTVTVQFKEGQLGEDFRSVKGKFNTMLDKGDYSMTKGDAVASDAQKEKGGAAKK